MVKALSFVLPALALSRSTLSTRTVVPGEWHQVSRSDGHHQIVFTVALKQQNLDVLEAKFWEVSDPTHAEYQNFMSIADIDEIIKPKEEDKAAVMSWLHEKLQTKIIEEGGDHIRVRAPAKQVEELFKSEIHLFNHDNGHMVARTMGEHSVPDDIRASIDFVSGLTEFPVPAKNHKVPKPDANTIKSSTNPAVIPQSLTTMYKVPSKAEAHISQGVVEFQDDASYNKKDLNTFFKQLDFKPETVTDTVGPYSGTYPDTEATLDTQYIMGVGQNEVDWYWTSAAWMYDFSTNFFNHTSVPDAVSISWGWAEDGQCQNGIDQTVCSQIGVDAEQYITRVNTEFQKIGLRGVSLLAASGDSGANGRTDGECTGTVLHASFPGSSPYITAVGATQLQDAKYTLDSEPQACTALKADGFKCASGGTEVAVSSQVAGFTSGGGFSTYLPVPAYQKDATAAYFKTDVKFPPSSYFNASNRGYPDVAAMGNNFAVYIQGEWTTVGGTSASSPTFAAVAGFMNSASQEITGKPLGFLNPLLYKMHADSPDTFTDVTIGDNKCTESGCFSSCKGYECAKGWDPVTGLGTPVADKMIAYVTSMHSSKSVSV